MLEQFSATIDLLYAAAADASLWDRALSSIEALTGSGVVVHLVPKSEPTPSLNLLGRCAQEHFPADDVQEWSENLASACPRLAAGSRWPDAPYVVDYMILSEAEMDRDPVYDWYGRHNLRYFIGSTLAETPRHRFMWSLQRRSSQGHAQEQDIRLFQLLKPHVSRALAMADQLGTIQEMRRCTVDVLEASADAILALDVEGQVLLENSTARDLLATKDGLYLEAGRLRTGIASEQVQLDGAIIAAAQARGGRGWMKVSRPSGGPPYALFVAPLSVGSAERTLAQAGVLVIVHDMASQSCANIEMLIAILGLTEAEAKLASALSAGHSIESSAALLGIRPATARSELKSVFRKTGVSRQQDLVRVLTALASVSKA